MTSQIIFPADSLKQAVGHETIKLMVNVDEDDYEIGRLKLLQNLMDWQVWLQGWRSCLLKNAML